MKPQRLPRTAKPRAIGDHETEYVVGRRVVARIYWHDTGAIERETHFDADGRMHGIERECFEDGSTRYLASWKGGLQHGLQQQWDERGKLVVQQPFARGTGLDVWFDGARLSETREFVDGHRHGYERWWRTSTQLSSEMHFEQGLEHGIHREWTPEGLRRGFPTFYVAGKKVARTTYERARAKDDTLPAWTAADDKPRRPKVTAAVVRVPASRKKR